MQPNSSEQLRKAYRTTVVMGVAMIGTLVVYAVLVELIKRQNAPFGGFNPLPDVIDTLRYALLGVAVAEFFVIQILNKIMLSAKTPVAANAASGPFGPEVPRLISAAIISFALCESVAVYGLVLFLIQGRTTDFYLFLLISLAYFGVCFPRFGSWEEWLQEREKAPRR